MVSLGASTRTRGTAGKATGYTSAWIAGRSEKVTVGRGTELAGTGGQSVASYRWLCNTRCNGSWVVTMACH